MSKLGDIYSSYGRQFSVAVANTYTDNIMNAYGLPQNTIIFASPYDVSTGDDLGTPSIIVTDSEGTPVLLSKTISVRNGLFYSNDSLSMLIDNTTIKTKNNELYVDLNAFTNLHNGLSINNLNKLYVNQDTTNRASATKLGVVKPDDSTIKSDNGTIHIDTSKLDHASNILKGTVIGDNKTIKIINGAPQIITANLGKSEANTYGVVMPDNVSIVSNNGELSVKETYFINDSELGLVKVDGKTIISNNGVLSVNLNEVSKASETKSGVIKYDGSQFETNSLGQLSVKNYDTFVNRINEVSARVQAATQEVEEIESEIANL